MSNLAVGAVLTLAGPGPRLWVSVGVTLVFATFGRMLSGVTNSGAIAGAITCFALLAGDGWGGFAALCTVFVVTWIATRFGYARKQFLGTAEARSGRTAAQVFANIGISAICAVAALITRLSHPLVGVTLELGSCAALCEAAADTVSSEIGQAVGGLPRLITSWRRVKSGSNGAITPLGTIAGVAAATIVSLVYGFFGMQGWRTRVLCACAGILGTFVDSLLGATVEHKKGIGNNAVNLLSTLAAALVAMALI